MTDDQIIAIRRATLPKDYAIPWADTIAFARAVESWVKQEVAQTKPKPKPQIFPSTGAWR